MYAKINWKERKKKSPKQSKANDDEHKNSKNNTKWTEHKPRFFPISGYENRIKILFNPPNQTARSAQLVFFETKVVCISFRLSSADVVMKSVE